MIKELLCLERIDQKNYLTEREHKEFLKIVQDGLLRLEKYEDVLKKEKLTIINEENNYELKVCANNYSHQKTHEMIQDVADKLGKLEDIYDESHRR